MEKTIKLGKFTNEQYIKACRKGSRDAELENSIGFKSTHKVHKSKKNYTRKTKHKSQQGRCSDVC